MTTIPFEQTDTDGLPHAMSPELMRDPFDGYGRLRELAPVVAGRYLDGTPSWFVTRFDDVRELLRDRRLVNTPTSIPGWTEDDPRTKFMDLLQIPERLRGYMLGSMLDSDPPDHTRLRRLVRRAFTARRILALKPKIEKAVHRLLEDLSAHCEDDGSVDLIAHFASPISMRVICDLVGIPDDLRAEWQVWAHDLINMRPENLVTSFPAMIESTHRLIDRRRADLADDLLSELIRGQQDSGGGITDVEIVTFVVTLVLAGHETTANLISNGTAALLAHPAEFAYLKAHPDAMPSAVHELMRWCGPVQTSRLRFAAEDFDIAGTPVRRGDAVLLVLVSANFDPRHYEQPDRLDLRRHPAGLAEDHLGFGHGMHYCLGASLGRMEAEIAFGSLIEHYPDLALAVDTSQLEKQERMQLPGHWRLARLPVILNGR
jgi:cytochrome P450